jgi:hypothetical protein
MKKVFYIIEPIDVDGDKIPDGFLASQYRIDKYGNKIFLKNKFITFANFKSRINKKGGAERNPPIKLKPNNNDVIVMSKDEYNKFMNQNAYYQQYPHQPNNPYPQYPQYPPGVLVNNGQNGNGQNTFMGNVANAAGQGVGLGFGFAAGDALFDGVASFF